MLELAEQWPLVGATGSQSEQPVRNHEAAQAVLLAAARARASRADNTLRAYRSDWADWLEAAAALGFSPDPAADTVSVYLDQLARRGAKVATIMRRLAGINAHLRAAGATSLSAKAEPLASVLRGIQRETGRPQRQARAIEVAEIRELVGGCGADAAGLRDRAILLLGFAGAFRRSELAGLTWKDGGDGLGHVVFVPEGLRVVLRRSKTNQVGAYEEVAVAFGGARLTCPVRALQDWRDHLGDEPAGPVFRAVDRHGRVGQQAMSGAAVADIVKRAVGRSVARAGATEQEIRAAAGDVSGHSLRAGLVTTAFAAGLPADAIARQTRHRNVNTLVRYRRFRCAFQENVSGKVGL